MHYYCIIKQRQYGKIGHHVVEFFDILRVRHETSCKRSFAWLEPEQYEYSLHTNVISAGSFGSHLSIGNIIFVAHCRPKAIVTVHEYDKLGNGNLACIWPDKPY